MTPIFEHLRIIDLTQGMAGPLATMILADYGADVIRLEPPGGDPMWAHPAYMVWNRGKKSVALDWSSQVGRDQAHQLVRGADIFIESLRPGEAGRLGLGYEALAAANPALIFFSLSAFGQEGPYKNLKPYDGIINAKSGRMHDQPGWQGHRPTYRAVNDVSYHTAMFTVQALVAALRVRLMTGRGQRVETSLLGGVTAPNNPWRRFEGQSLPPDIYPRAAPKDAVIRGELVLDRHESDPYTAVPSQICAECKDGRWIMHSHIQPDLFKAWINAIGLGWIWDDPRFGKAPSFAKDEDRVALNLMIFERMKEKTSFEWREIYRRNPDCAGETMQTTQEAIGHEQFIANGHIIELDDPRVGRIKQVGAFARMSETPAVIARHAPQPGQHTDEVLAGMPVAPIKIKSTGGRPKRPLEGVIMLELATWLAAPFAGALLADLGARVIKIEALAGDPFRLMPSNENMIRAFQGKENVALNLKSKEGQEIFHKLVARADILMHNFRPGAPARIGADYETLRKIKPDLVYVYAGSYGSKGPDSLRAAFNPTMGAFSGNSLFQSGEGNLPKGDQSPDPMAGSGVATGIMLGLAARLLTGKGQYIETSMMNSNVYANSDDAFDYAGKPTRRVPDKAQLGLEATYRLYETTQGWVFLAVQFDHEFAAFCKVIGREDLAHDARFASWAGRYDNRVVLGDELELVFRTRSAEEWESLLTAADLGCVTADGSGHRRFLYEDPHMRAIGFMTPTQSRAFADQAPGGKYWRHAPVVRFSETPCEAGKPYCGLGEHTQDVLRELGYDSTAIARFKEANVIGMPIDKVLSHT
ncbi:MAG: CoA transferase [Rhodospirillaceae bacterium]|nr:MAG: CoA transferase [Rhodospirillaceae bacterium]